MELRNNHNPKGVGHRVQYHHQMLKNTSFQHLIVQVHCQLSGPCGNRLEGGRWLHVLDDKCPEVCCRLEGCSLTCCHR